MHEHFSRWLLWEKATANLKNIQIIYFQKNVFLLGVRGSKNHFFVNGFEETFYGYFYYPSLKRLARRRVENRASL